MARAVRPFSSTQTWFFLVTRMLTVACAGAIGLVGCLVRAEDEIGAADHGTGMVIVEETAEAPVGNGTVPSLGFLETGRFMAGAEYLLLQPAFGNATALLENTRTSEGPFEPFSSSLQAKNYDFDAASGVRAFIGYQFSSDALFRFSYMDVSASTDVSAAASGNWDGGNGTIVFGPYYTEAIAPGETIRAQADVDLDIYDLEWARRVDLGGGESCRLPMWDGAWGVGLRFLDTAVGTNVLARPRPGFGFPDIQVTTDRSFHGVGPRMAGQLRRYVGASRRWSGFASIGGGLLVGSLDDTATRTTLDEDRTFESQEVGGTKVIPNLDLSLGGSWQVAERTSISIGWMLMYFGDLGYAETVVTEPVVTGPDIVSVASVPLASSSLTLDGAFFRLTHTF